MIQVKLLNENASVPTYANPNDAGLDLYSSENIVISPQNYIDYDRTLNKTIQILNRKLVSTGISMVIPEGFYGRVSPRSGMSCKGFDIGAGVVDSDYRGEIKVLFINNSGNYYEIKKGEKFAQMVITKIINNPRIEVVSELSETIRGDGGFGSTGN